MTKPRFLIISLFTISILITSIFAGLSLSDHGPNNVNALYILPDKFGANNYLMLDDLESYGWNVTFAGTQGTIKPCPGASSVFGAKEIIVDYVIGDPINIDDFDCVIIGPASWRFDQVGGYIDLAQSNSTHQLLREFNSANKTIYATCAGVRVLGIANILNGVKVTGRPEFASQFELAGGIFQGTGILPVIDGNIVTTSRGLYFHLQNSEAVAARVYDLELDNNISGGASEIVEGEINIKHSIWTKTIGGEDAEEFFGITKLADKTYIAVGYTFSNGEGNCDLLLTKFNQEGNIIWNKTFGNEGWEYAHSVSASSDGGFVVTGYVSSSETVSKDVLVAKFDADGENEWYKNIGGNRIDVGKSIIEAPDNNFVVCGYTESFGAGRDDLYLLKLDTSGELIWSQTFGGEESDRGNFLINTEDGNFALVGSTGSFGTGNRDIYFLKVDNDGNRVLERFFHDSNYDRGTSLAQTPDGGYIITGCSDYYESEPMDLYLLKIDANANFEWHRKYKEGNFYDYGSMVQVTEDGGYLLYGTSKFYDTDNQLYIIKTDAAGEIQWKNVAGGDKSDWANAFIISDDGNYLLVGRTKSGGAGSSDGLIIKLSAMFPDFNLSPKSGHAPLKINVENNSYGPIANWNWDFDSDGQIDSEEKNPEYTFENPGNFYSTLNIDDGINFLTADAQIPIKVFNGESAINFVENKSYASIKADPKLNLRDSFTIEGWIKPTGWAESTLGEAMLFSKNSIEIFFNKNPVGAKKENSIVISIWNEDGTRSYLATDENIFLLNNWYHIAVTYQSSSSQAVLYLNGLAKRLSPYDKTPNGLLKDNETQKLSIGNKSFLHKPFQGIIDEIRIWNTAQNAQEIQSNMKKYLTGNEENLLAYWNFNEGNGEVIIDKTINNFEGIISKIEWEQSIDITTITDIQNNREITLPASYRLSQNYPNPFNPETIISYSIAANSVSDLADVTLTVFDLLGQKIKTLVNKKQAPGIYTIYYNASDLASGVYIYRLTAGNFVDSKKMVVLR